jgi:membrane associated rhomboid family serine protease
MKMKHSVTDQIIAACVGCFLAQFFWSGFTDVMAASVNHPTQVWRMFTYTFVHGGFLHILLNMLCLYSFGRTVEKKLGKKKYLALYAFSGFTGALVALPIMYLKGGVGLMVGASAAILGVLYHFVKANPNAMLIVLVFPCRAKNFLKGFIILSIVCCVFGFLPIVSHEGHLGGILGGWLFAKFKPLTKRGKSKYDWSDRSKPLSLDL